jgi:TetR/AcrR family fatty acid metabolism transcriptional regulator
MAATPHARPSPRQGSKLRKADVLTEFRRQGLLDAARRVFGRDGFEGATVEAIARQARVAKGTVYLYYPSKRAIFDAAFKGCMADLEQITRERVEAAATLRPAITAFIATRGQFFQDRPDFFRMYVGEIAAQVTARRRRSACRSMLDRQMALLERALTRAVERGEIRPVDPAATATAIFDMTRGMVSRHLLTAERPDPGRDAQVLTELIWNGLAPTPTQE